MGFNVKNRQPKLAATLLAVSVVYFVTARFGLTLNAVSGFATLVWAPTGIAIASVFLLGYRVWPAITLAALLVNIVTGASPLVAAGIAVGNTLEAVIGAYLLKRFARLDPRLERVRDVFGLVFYAAVASTIVSATVGVTSLWLGGAVSGKTYAATWLAWWIGDMLGAIVVAPLVLVWSQHLNIKIRKKTVLEATAYLLLLIGISGVVFRGIQALHIQPFTFVYLTFPILIWMALRFGQIGSVTATFVASATAIWGTVTSSHVSGAMLSRKLLLLQIFMGISTVTFMTLAALVAEREQTQRQKQQLAQRTALLARQRVRLLALNKAKDEFISLASHQLRTPATIVKVYAGMLQSGYAGKLTGDQKELLQTALTSNERQLELIDMLLRVARVDSGKVVLHKQDVDLALLVSEVVGSYSENAAARKQTIHFQKSQRAIIAKIDKEKVRMALENIVDNASKYSPSGRDINVRLQRRKKQVIIAVQDSGVGILQKDIPKLFKKFSRIDNSLSMTVDGTGLGLYWAKKIIALHRGSIEVASSPSKGSTFTIVLPSHDA